MSLVTARRAITYPNPDRSDRPDIPAFFGDIIPFLDADVVYNQGTDAARIAAAHQTGGGRFWWTTDTLHVWYDDGAAWHQVDSNPAAGNQIGTFAARPAANAVSAGTVYFATDTLGQWRSDGAAWTLIDQGTPLIAPSALSTLPGPYDGQMVSLQADATNAVNWTFRYNAGSASALKWECIGGTPLEAEVATSETTTSIGTYVDLTTVGPSVTLPRTGDYLVTLGSGVNVPAANTGAKVSYAIGATTAADADAMRLYTNTGAQVEAQLERKKRQNALTSATVLKSKYKGDAASGTHTFNNRYIEIMPIRIS